MGQMTEKQLGATAAASFNLMVLQQYYSGQENDLADDLKEGLIQNNTQGDAWEIIQTFADGNGQLTATPAELAMAHPDECIALGQLFAKALLKDARAEQRYLDVIPMDRKNMQVSKVLSSDAPDLARLFKPVYN